MDFKQWLKIRRAAKRYLQVKISRAAKNQIKFFKTDKENMVNTFRYYRYELNRFDIYDTVKDCMDFNNGIAIKLNPTGSIIETQTIKDGKPISIIKSHPAPL